MGNDGTDAPCSSPAVEPSWMTFLPVKLFVGILFQPQLEWSGILEKLESEIGDADFISKSVPFSHSTYYENEMGPGLLKAFVGIKAPFDPADLSKVKQQTCGIEQEFRIGDQRTINLDPGLVTLHNVILASTKNFSHRIPLQDGIYAEVTLLYQNGGYQALPWSYPDFQFPFYQSALLNLRALHKTQLEVHSRSIMQERPA